MSQMLKFFNKINLLNNVFENDIKVQNVDVAIPLATQEATTKYSKESRLPCNHQNQITVPIG